MKYLINSASDYFDELSDTIIAAVEPWRLPAIACSICGPIGYGKHLSWRDGNEDIPTAGKLVFVPAHDWMQMRGKWADSLRVPPDRLTPGMRIGRPRAVEPECTSSPLIRAGSGRWWIRKCVLAQLDRDYGISDLRYVVIEGWRSYVELIIEEYAFVRMARCAECGRAINKPNERVIYDAALAHAGNIIHLTPDNLSVIVNECVARVLLNNSVPHDVFIAIK